MSELYNTKILRLAASIPHTTRLDNPDVTVVKTSRICGSRVTVDLKMKDGVITEYGQEVKACALGQASCSIVGGKAIGQTLTSFLPVKEAMEAMLKNQGPIPSEGWGVEGWDELEIFEPAIEHKSRHSAIMLPFEAIVEGLEICTEGVKSSS
jgi:NifU-like protein involved in Fe-S cluster formation